jgi:exonuclease III
MIVATFNVNGIGSRLAALLEWLEKAAPDIVCLQELKATDARFPIVPLRRAGYGAIWHGQASWNGVAILAKGIDPKERRRGLPGGPDTFWDYFRDHWPRNAGLRIDHLLLNGALSPRLVAAGVDSWVRAGARPSDHVPAWVRLADSPSVSAQAGRARKAVHGAKPNRRVPFPPATKARRSPP